MLVQIMRITFFLFFLSLFMTLTAQSGQDTLLQQKVSIPPSVSFENTWFGIQIMPLSFSGRNPRLRLGLNVQRDRWRYMVDLEYGNEGIRNFARRNSDLHYSFAGIRPEMQYALLHKHFNHEINQYLALEIPFNFLEREFVNGHFEGEGVSYAFDNAIQKRLRWSILFKTGLTMTIAKSIYLDYYTGFGIAWRNIRYDDIVNLHEDNPGGTREWGFLDEQFPPGKKCVPDLAFGLRIGYFIVR